jgi:hypothetical protein
MRSAIATEDAIKDFDVYLKTEESSNGSIETG